MNAERMFLILLAGVRYLLGCGLFAVSLVWPRDDMFWVFGANRGAGFGGNSKHLYCYTANERNHIRAVWLSEDEAVIEELRGRGYEAYHADSVRGILANLRAGVVFVSHGVPDVNKWCCGGATTVSLWHGVGLKHVGWDYGLETDRVGVLIRRYLVWRLFTRPDRVVVTSEAMVEPFASAFRVNPRQILVTGYPRNDALVGTIPTYGFETPKINEILKRFHDDSTVLIYTPTYREGTNGYVRNHLDLYELDRRLAELDAHLLVKLHPWEEMNIADGEFSRIVQLPSGLDVYPLLKHTDALITDYSSIYFDYLLLDKPVVFYPFDLEEYRTERGFYLDYEAVTPGLVATDFDELVENIAEVVETDSFVDERRAVCERYLAQPTGTRCELVCDHFDPLATTRS